MVENKLLNQINKLLKQDIIKVFSLTTVSTVVRMITALISVKVISQLIGPSGIAILGQLNNFSAIILTLASGGISSGVTKYVAEHRESKELLKSFLSTGLRIILCCSATCGLLMVFFSGYLSRHVMLSGDYTLVFILFGLTIVLYALNVFINSILNGYKEFKLFVYINIAGSLFGLCFTIVFVYCLGIIGALISAVTFQSVIFFISLWMVRKLSWFSKDYLARRIDRSVIKKYFRYSAMTLVTAATLPVTQLILRSRIISQLSIEEAGWWEAINRMSNMYLMVITTSFVVYYLPKLSEIKSNKDLKLEISKAFTFLAPLLIIGFSILYIFRSFIISALFSRDFLGMESLFLGQLIGDFFKICSWILANVMVARAMTKEFIITEILFAALFLLLGLIFINIFGTIGLTFAYAVAYFVYFLSMVILFRKIIFARH